MESSVKAHGPYPTNVMTDYLTGLPVYSVVIYLVKHGTVVESCYKDEVAGQRRLLDFQSIKLWEVPGEMLKQKELEGLLPLLPLTQGGKSRAVVEETIAQLQATDHQDLLPLSYVFAGLVFKKAADKLWLKERFDKMQDILEASWAYQDLVGRGLLQGLQQGLKEGREEGRKEGREEGREEGRKEGRKEGLKEGHQQAAIDVVVARFPDLETLARTKITAINDLQRLRHLITDLSISLTREQMERVLLSLDA